MRRLSIVLAVVATAAVGCGDNTDTGTVVSPAPVATGSPEESPTGSPPVTLSGQVNDHGSETLTGMSAELELELDNFYFEPTFVRADRGARISAKLKNEGSVPHTFTIDSLRIDRTLQPDQEAELMVNLPTAAAPLTFYCKFHRAQGMQGAFYFQ